MNSNKPTDSTQKLIVHLQCNGCQFETKVQIFVLSQPEARFKDVSCFCISPHVRLDWDSTGTLLFVHRQCLNQMAVVHAVHLDSVIGENDIYAKRQGQLLTLPFL